VRREVYESFLRKHIGWYDQRENSPGDLTNILASDVQILNGISSEGLAVIIEANSSIITGLIIGFYFCW
jgi:ABC-type multidrug transport system fused ATPase/permease subunit